MSKARKPRTERLAKKGVSKTGVKRRINRELEARMVHTV